MLLPFSYSEPLLMRSFSFITLLFFSCLSLAAQDRKEEIIQKLKSIEGWDLQFTIDKTDTTKHRDYLSLKPEIRVSFKTDIKEGCISPTLNIYPIEFSDYVKKHNDIRLMLRAMAYPPRPYEFVSHDYFMIGWNFEGYDIFRDCGGQKLKETLIGLLKLQLTKAPTPSLKRYEINDLPIAEVRSIIQQAIDLPELQQYFKNAKGEFPEYLGFEELDPITQQSMKGIQKFDRDVKVLHPLEALGGNRIKYLDIGQWEIDGTALKLLLYYKYKGLRIDYTFEKKGHDWVLKKASINKKRY